MTVTRISTIFAHGGAGIDATAIDHMDLRIPAGGLDTAVGLYHDVFGSDVEDRDLFESGEKPFISVQFTPTSVIHLRPAEDFKPPAETAFDRIAIRSAHDIDELCDHLETAGVEIDRQLEPLGTASVMSAVYVIDPLGYMLELKAAPDADWAL